MKTFDNQPDGEGKMKCMATGWMRVFPALAFAL
jgi:hypothetical protein